MLDIVIAIVVGLGLGRASAWYSNGKPNDEPKPPEQDIAITEQTPE